MKIQYTIIVTVAIFLLASQPGFAEEPSAFGSGFDVQDFYKPFTLDEITPQKQLHIKNGGRVGREHLFQCYVRRHWQMVSELKSVASVRLS